MFLDHLTLMFNYNNYWVIALPLIAFGLGLSISRVLIKNRKNKNEDIKQRLQENDLNDSALDEWHQTDSFQASESNTRSSILWKSVIFFCLGIFIGFLVREGIRADYWGFKEYVAMKELWEIGLVLLIFSIGIIIGRIMKNKGLKDEIDALAWRFRRIEPFVSQRLALEGQRIQKTSDVQRSDTDEQMNHLSLSN